MAYLIGELGASVAGIGGGTISLTRAGSAHPASKQADATAKINFFILKPLCLFNDPERFL
jgi:hypothetical protein